MNKLEKIDKLEENEKEEIIESLLKRLKKKDISEINATELLNYAGDVIANYMTIMATDDINFKLDIDDFIEHNKNDIDEIGINGINSIIANDINDLFKLLRYINFNYYIFRGKFEEAKKIYEMDLRLFNYFKNPKCKALHMINDVLVDTDSASFEELALHDFSYDYIDKINMDSLTSRTVKVMLNFYISCYYYFKHFKDNENANKAYEFLLYFKKGYGIEDFFIKYRYIKMAENICELKNDDVDKIDEAVDLINNKIAEMKIISTFDIEDVVKSYPYIKFENLDDKVKTYIATGDKIINTFDNDRSTEFDYSSAVIEWSKAVELEINNKFISQIAKYKYDIEKYSRQKNPDKNRDFVLDTKNATIGIYNAIRKYRLQDYLYDEYFSKLYTFEKNTYNELCQYIRDIWETRNDSAHKEKSINVVTATECKNKILKVNKILEILSKLEKSS